MDLSAEDLTMGRHGSQVAPDDDDDDHDDHDDNDKINDTEGVDPERLKAFNVSWVTPSSLSPHGSIARPLLFIKRKYRSSVKASVLLIGHHIH